MWNLASLSPRTIRGLVFFLAKTAPNPPVQQNLPRCFRKKPITLDIASHSAYGPRWLVTLSSCEYLLARAQFRRHSRQPAIRPVLRTRQAYRGMRRLRVDRVDCTRVVRLPASARSCRRLASGAARSHYHREPKRFVRRPRTLEESFS
jgi:hypothetical protein